jgi:hypothetical protein
MQGLSIRIAKGLNSHWGRKGKVFDDRYHARVLRTPLEVRRGIAYVINNSRKHARERGSRLARGWIDPFSSGASFDGWSDARRRPRADEAVESPRSWMLRIGWRRHGLIGIEEVPGASRR